ncbi:hypothetical protein CAEBREN_24330 [Caenorhabditis brenneri]|uniref:Uncharacterized protein n=1 Tax=Caenorhabditis brenneri TaxID=135651 RepID=G0ME43_CAEBE|nr:hypothetical protein CAEBREN_24330 [Caenorhabditis brenneri]
MSCSFFTDGRTIVKAVLKPRKCLSSLFLRSLMILISESINPKKASVFAIGKIDKLYQLNTPEEVEELNDLEIELMELRGNFKACVNETEVRIYATKILNLVIYMVAIAAYILFKLYCNHTTEPIKSEQLESLLKIMFGAIVLSFCISHTLKFKLIHDSAPDTDNYLNNVRMSDVELSMHVKKKQRKLIILYSEEVLPMEKKATDLSKARITLKIVSAIPIYALFFICFYCFVTRYMATKEPIEAQYAFGTFIIAVCLVPIVFNLL